MKTNKIDEFKRILKEHWLEGLVLLLGVGLRLVLAGITVHPDLLSISAGDFLLFKKGVVNIYEYLAQAPASERVIEVYGRSFFTYPPLAYFTLGFFNFLLSPLFSGELYTRFLGGVRAFSGLGFDTDLLILKVPYLIFDLLLAALLFKIFEKDRKKAWLAFYLWFFNPLSLYTSFMVGQFDIIPTFLVVLSVFWTIRERRELAALSLGIGASLKMFPLFFLPILILVLGKSFWQKLKLTAIGILPYLVSIAPFMKTSAFRQTVLFSGQSQKMLFMTLPVSGAEGVYLFIFGLVLIYLYTAYKQSLMLRNKGQQEKIWQYYFWVLLLFFSVTHYHPQWFLWLTPFLIWTMIESNWRRFWPSLILVGCWLVITLLFEPSLSVGLFAPILPQLKNVSLGNFGTLSRGAGFRFAGGNLDAFQIRSLTRSIFDATSFWLAIF